MQSVFLTAQIGKLDPKIWNVFNSDNCAEMSDQHLANTWSSENKSRYVKDFVAYMDKIITNKDQICSSVS
jgi:hypothetical protein